MATPDSTWWYHRDEFRSQKEWGFIPRSHTYLLKLVLSRTKVTNLSEPQFPLMQNTGRHTYHVYWLELKRVSVPRALGTKSDMTAW